MSGDDGANRLRYRLTVAYDGTAYAGWQVQPNGLTIQEVLETELRGLCGHAVKVHGSGRTDQGVHARGQVAHVDLERCWMPRSLLAALNARLPGDIRILKVARVAPDFHARKSAVEKEYRYFIWNGDVLPPNLRLYRLHVRRPLDVVAMRRAAGALVGRHDFAAFTANPNRAVESTVRTLYELSVRKRGSEVVIVARGEGFLYKMVRSLAGYLVRVGEGNVDSAEATVILESRERTARVPTALPQGLFLWRVRYGGLQYPGKGLR